MYIKRHAEKSIEKLRKAFGAVLLTGARQTGKTTLLQKMYPDLPYCSMDDRFLLESASENSATFLKEHGSPVILDEIQYAPALFPRIKLTLDAEKKKGQYLMSGSQQFHLMKNVSESLAGRVGLQILPGLSMRETEGAACTAPFLPEERFFSMRAKDKPAPYTMKDVWERIWWGDMPALHAEAKAEKDRFYAAYVRTYLDRDVHDLLQVGDARAFMDFMTAVASLSGSMLNLSKLARDIGVSQPTAKRWLSVLEASHLVFLLPPFHVNIAKRVVKTPKVYFMDTGLVSYLTRWKTPEVLQNGAMSGAVFETFVVSEIVKGYYNSGSLDIPLYYYRDSNGCEIDLLIEANGVLHPLEIKRYADPKRSDTASFRVLEKLAYHRRGAGGLICLYDMLMPLSGEDRVIPAWYL